ncbi:MAG: hypothetical protein K6A95_05895, partial [Bacteroidales bacterium]|nr:hypothetical protein [Bacteroidales bacterium]
LGVPAELDSLLGIGHNAPPYRTKTGKNHNRQDSVECRSLRMAFLARADKHISLLLRPTVIPSSKQEKRAESVTFPTIPYPLNIKQKNRIFAAVFFFDLKIKNNDISRQFSDQFPETEGSV